MSGKRVAINKILFICLIVFSFVPDIGLRFTLAGFTWTAYRLTIAICLISVIIVNKRIVLHKHFSLTQWVIFMAFWVLYGLMLMLAGGYSDIHSGLVEWLSIVNGLVVIYYMSNMLVHENNRTIAINVIYWVLSIMIVMGLMEIVTGHHWATSAFNDPASSVSKYANTHMATGLMYNMNDFSAMLTCMSPVLLDSRLREKRILTLIGLVAVNFINDANACNFAIIIFALYYLLILRGGKTKRAFAFKLLFWGIALGAVVFIVLSGTGLTKRRDFLGAMARLIFNARNSSGSLYARMIIYRDALTVWWSNKLGLGPGGFAKYFTAHRSLSGLVNPHSLVLEILTQYGIIVAGWFLGLLLWMYLTSVKQLSVMRGKMNDKNLMIIAFVIIYFIVSFAPSSFIGYAYQWLMIAVVCSYLQKHPKNHETGSLLAG